MGVTLADSISYLPHLAAFDQMVKDRFSEIQLDGLLMYVIDTVDASALPYLAEQFDVLGYKGFRLAKTEQDQRNIIKQAIELHRYKGTLWAVKQSLISIGFGDATITEHTGHWADFTVTIKLGDRELNAAEIDDLVNMINEYKNVRSRLVGLQYKLKFDDAIQVDDSNAFIGPGDAFIESMNIGVSFFYDGAYNYNGDRAYDPDQDVLIVTIM